LGLHLHSFVITTKPQSSLILNPKSVPKALTGDRLEVLRAGFNTAWAAKDYATILAIANKLPEETLQEDERLLTLYDMALTRTEDGA